MAPSEHDPNEQPSYIGLRLRLWLACISGGLIAGLGTLWVLGARVPAGGQGATELQAWLAGVAFASIGFAMLVALWLDHHIVGHLRGLLRGLRSGRVAELRGLPSAAGWGELTELTDLAQALLVQHRQSAHAAQELEQVRTQLAALQAAIEQWLQTESWEAPAIGPGPLAASADALTRGFTRLASVNDQNAQAARQVAVELATALADATESAEQAERGFVEATAMLTTVRELQRLSGELQTSLNALPMATPAPAGRDDDAARAALELLVDASRESVDAIGRGMLRVQDVSALVQQLANRATLVAIHAVTAGARPEGGGDLADELKTLVHEVREATDRTSEMAYEIEAAVAEASERMRDARERAFARLDAPTSAPVAHASPRAFDDAQRLHERVREMVQDAASKGERLSAAGERASRAAQRLARRVGEESSEAQALVVRLTPVGASPATPVATPPPSRELRLLDDDADDANDAGGDTDASGEERP